MSAGHLMRERRFAPFFWTQFLGATNDNVFKFAFTLLVTYQASNFGNIDVGLIVALIPALFILPFLLFSATSGQLADKWDKTRIFRMVKWLEVGIVVLACIGIYTHALWLLLVCTFLLGLHSTVFGPAKYAYLPAHLKTQELIGGNGLLEMGTFLAILLGTILGGMLANTHTLWLCASLIVLSLAGLFSSYAIPLTPSTNPNLAIDWNPIRVTMKNLRLAKEQQSVFLSLLGISWLWFVGAIFLTVFAPFAKTVLFGNQDVVTVLLVVFSVGIAVGSLLCERLSGRLVEIGLVPFGSIGMSLFAFDLYMACAHLGSTAPSTLYTISTFLADTAHWRILVDLFGLAMFAGLYSVPLYALIQTRAPEGSKAQIIAANNILNALFMIAASGLIVLVTSVLALPLISLFLMVAILNGVVALYIYRLVPEFLLRFVAWLLIHSIYRVRKDNETTIPAEGAAVLIANHVSFVDAIVLMAVSPRPIRFVMDHNIFKNPILGWIFRTAKAIPIASAKVDPVLLEKAYVDIAQALSEGELVCIFPEGRITDTGQLYPFKNGIQRIVETTPVPIVPVALCGLWGSFFSRRGGKAFSWKNIGWASPIRVLVGETTDISNPSELQTKVQELITKGESNA
jgi:1-acyl-sn-glycerol-3-phosphate acyltransferase